MLVDKSFHRLRHTSIADHATNFKRLHRTIHFVVDGCKNSSAEPGTQKNE